MWQCMWQCMWHVCGSGVAVHEAGTVCIYVAPWHTARPGACVCLVCGGHRGREPHPSTAGMHAMPWPGVCMHAHVCAATMSVHTRAPTPLTHLAPFASEKRVITQTVAGSGNGRDGLGACTWHTHKTKAWCVSVSRRCVAHLSPTSAAAVGQQPPPHRTREQQRTAHGLGRTPPTHTAPAPRHPPIPNQQRCSTAQ